MLLLGPVLYAVCRVPRWILSGLYTVQEGSGLLVARSGPDTWTPAGGLAQALYDFGGWSFLHHMALVFLPLFALIGLAAKLRPRAPVRYPVSSIDTSVRPAIYVQGAAILAATAALYMLFW